MNTRHLQLLASFCAGVLVGASWLCCYSRHASSFDCNRTDTRDRTRARAPLAREDLGASISSLIFYNLPLAGNTAEFNIGRVTPNAQQVAAPQVGLLPAGIRFADDNLITLDKPFGHFVLDTGGNVLGLRLLPTSPTESRAPELGFLRNGDEIIHFEPTRTMYYSWLNTPIKNSGYEYALRDLKSLSSLGKLAFVDFGVARFEDGFWESFERTAAAVALKGLVVRNGGDFLRRRDGRPVPSITGLVIAVDNADDILACGAAFPNLKFLYLLVPHSVMGNLGRGLPSAFGNLEALMISMEPSISLADWLANVADQPASSLHPDMFPRKLKWLCIDGCLLSVEGMRVFDLLGMRYAALQVRGRTSAECVFVGMGYSREAARFLRKGEYPALEAYWLR